jgi:hypothetical protein
MPDKSNLSANPENTEGLLPSSVKSVSFHGRNYTGACKITIAQERRNTQLLPGSGGKRAVLARNRTIVAILDRKISERSEDVNRFPMCDLTHIG